MIVARAVPPQAPRRASSATRQRELWTARLAVRVHGRLAVRDSPGSEDVYRTHSRERDLHRYGPYTIMGMGGTACSVWRSIARGLMVG